MNTKKIQDIGFIGYFTTFLLTLIAITGTRCSSLLDILAAVFMPILMLIASALIRMSTWSRIKSIKSKAILLLTGGTIFLLYSLYPMIEVIRMLFDIGGPEKIYFYYFFNPLYLFGYTFLGLAIVLIIEAIKVFRSKEIEKQE